MYVDMLVIGNALSGGKGWNVLNGKAADYMVPNTSGDFRTYKPDMSLCPGSGGLLLSVLILQSFSEGASRNCSLVLSFDALARLESAQLDTLDPNNGRSLQQAL